MGKIGLENRKPKGARSGYGLFNRQKSRIGLVAILATLIASILAQLIMANGGGTVHVTGQLQVPTTCTFVTSNAAINFGSISPGTNTGGTSSTYNIITVTDTGGNPSNILLSGSSWNYNSNTFTVTNTIWSAANIVNGIGANTAWNPQASSSLTGTTNVEVTLTGSQVDTLQYTSNGLAANTIWFGANVPPLTPGSGTSSYAQTINIISSC